jgi:hypothetical protein
MMKAVSIDIKLNNAVVSYLLEFSPPTINSVHLQVLSLNFTSSSFSPSFPDINVPEISAIDQVGLFTGTVSHT